jgi:hypothetical protein
MAVEPLKEMGNARLLGKFLCNSQSLGVVRRGRTGSQTHTKNLFQFDVLMVGTKQATVLLALRALYFG